MVSACRGDQSGDVARYMVALECPTKERLSPCLPPLDSAIGRKSVSKKDDLLARLRCIRPQKKML